MDIATLGIRIERSEATQLIGTLDKVAVAGAKAEASTGRLSRRMGLAEIEARKLDAALDAAGQTSGRLTGGFGGLAGAIQAVAGAMVVRQVIEMADAYKNLHARLSLVTTSTANLAAVEQSLFAISQGTRTGLESNVALYTALARSTKVLGLSQADLLAVTRTVSESFIVSGASASETNAAVRQLGQALASGVLRGDEFNSIAENAPRLQQAVAASLGVTIGQLRAMAAEGKITGAVITKALLEAGGAIHDEFTKIPTTVSGAMTQVKNAMLLAVGATDSASGSTAGLASALSSIAAAIPGIASTMNAFFGGIQLMAFDAGIAVEKLSGTFGRFLRDHPGVLAGATGALSSLGPLGMLAAGGLNSAAQGANESDDAVRLLERQRDEMITRLTAIGGAGVSTAHGKATTSDPNAASAAAKEAEKIFQASIEQRAEAYNHFVREGQREYEKALEQTVKDFEAAEKRKIDEAQEAAEFIAKDVEARRHEVERQAHEMQRTLRASFASFFTDLLTNGKSAFQSLFDAIKKGFIRLMAELAGEALQKRLAGLLGGMLFSRSGAGNTNPVSGLGLGMLKDAGAGALAGGLVGYGVGGMTQDRAAGGITGALSGAGAGFLAAGPIGAAAGALAGFVGGILGAGNAAREAAQRMQDLRASLALTIEGIKASLAGDEIGVAVARVKAEFAALRKAAEEAFPGGDQYREVARHAHGLESVKFWLDLAAKADAERAAKLGELNDLERQRIEQMEKEAIASRAASSASLNMVEGYKIQAAIFGAMTGRAAPFSPTVGRGTPMSGGGDLTLNVLMPNGDVLGKVVIRDFKNRQARGDAELASVLS